MPVEEAPRRTEWRFLLVAAIATACILLWLLLTVRYNYGGNWTALFCTGSTQRVPPELAANTYLFKPTPGYDGQFYRYIAHDPVFRRGYWQYVDDARCRYRRILVPFLAWALAGGRPEWIDFTFVVVVVASLGLGVYWSSRYVALQGRHPAWGAAFLLVPAALTSMDRMLLDGTLTAVFAGFLVAVRERSWRGLYFLCMIACLVRETGLLIAVACVLHWILERRYAYAARFATAMIPALAWYAFVAAHTRPSHASEIMTYPLVGILRRLFTIRPLGDPGFVTTVIHVTDTLAILGLIGSLVLAAIWAWRRQAGPARIAVLLFLALGLVLGSPSHMFEAYGYGRPVSPLLLFVLLEGIVTRLWAAMLAPLLVAMSVGLFFISPLSRILRGLGFY